MKHLGALLVLAFLAGCAGGSMPSVTPGVPNSDLNSMSVVSTGVSTGRAPHVLTASINSIVLQGTINNKPVNGYINAPSPCKATDKNGIAVGCGVVANAALTYKNLAAALFTQKNAKGCEVAIAAKITGRVAKGKAIPFVFKWTGKCK